MTKAIAPFMLFTVFMLPAAGQTVEQRQELVELVSRMDRGLLDIPAQWFEMKSAVGWERMMLVLGYANNEAVCANLALKAQNESPNRDFRCSPAN